MEKEASTELAKEIFIKEKIINQICKLLGILIKCITVAFIFHQFFKALPAIAGKKIEMQILINMIARLDLSQKLGYAVGGLSAIFTSVIGLLWKKDKNKIKQLEQQILNNKGD